ncbi:MAG TPA: tyrosinase family protein [Longimicrobiaceae bacterium]|nr:tyrosinase family protein [Longimicrobiaceae bacterium]
MEDMNRRDFVLAAALGGIGVAQGAHLLEMGELAAQPAAAEGAAVLYRRNVYCLSATSSTLTAYRNAVQTMKSRPATDPTSWLAQANIHGAFSPPAGMIANACMHDATFFLSWHRMYLHYFERIARAASGDATFALPYWGYSPTGARNLPAPFRTPADASNPLYASLRRATINGGGNLAASAVDPGAALAQFAFTSMSSTMDGTPHGVVHTGVGGFGGLMSEFETAGQDPIFWLHHANIDRLWEAWLASGGGRANPTTASWSTTPFTFYDETGAQVSLTGAQVVDTAAQLEYRYASTLCLSIIRLDRFDWRIFTRIPPWDPRVLRVMEVIRRRPPRPDPPPFAVQQGVPLRAAAAGVDLKFDPEAQRALASFPTAQGQGNDLSLVLEDIRLEGPPEVYYEVYVNLPADTRDTVYTSPHYVGNLDFFGPSPQGEHGRKPQSRVLGLLPTYARLRGMQRWRDDSVRITFVPRAYVEGEDVRQKLGDRTQATIGRVAVRVD